MRYIYETDIERGDNPLWPRVVSFVVDVSDKSYIHTDGGSHQLPSDQIQFIFEHRKKFIKKVRNF